jgi:hypothetical protein
VGCGLGEVRQPLCVAAVQLAVSVQRKWEEGYVSQHCTLTYAVICVRYTVGVTERSSMAYTSGTFANLPVSAFVA